jgi:iron(III) transport system substrate-binding protein
MTKTVLWLVVCVVFVPAVYAQPKSGWQVEWEKIVAAAKKEGKVVVLGPPGAADRRVLTEGFQRSFPGIDVEYTGASGFQIVPRLTGERKAGQYLADVHVGNPGSILASMLSAGMLDPIKPALLLPEVTDPSKWWEGDLEFSDQAGKYNLVFSTDVRTHVVINPKLVKREELNSYWDLLQPKWSGGIVMKDPTVRGPGQGTVLFWYIHPALGKSFIQRFFTEQKVNISNNDRQLLEWVAREQYPVAIGHSTNLATEFTRKGLSIEELRSEQFKEGSNLNAGFGSVVLINRAPHPNAAKVYLNWLLSKDGQTEWSRGSGYPSRRLDVPRDHLDPLKLPKEGVSYQKQYKEEYVRLQDEVSPFLETLLKR